MTAHEYAARDDFRRNWSAEDLDYLSRYDGLTAIRSAARTRPCWPGCGTGRPPRRAPTCQLWPQRLIDEGLRMADHPGVVFKDGPSGRRAALAYGPDIWEIVKFLREVDERVRQR